MPGKACKEGVVDCIRNTGKELASYGQDEQQLPTMLVGPGASQQGVTDPGGQFSLCNNDRGILLGGKRDGAVESFVVCDMLLDFLLLHFVLG